MFFEEKIPTLKVGQWVQAWDGSPGYVEKSYGEQGPYEIRLVSQWSASVLPKRSGVGFVPMTFPQRFSEQARQIADELWHILW